MNIIGQNNSAEESNINSDSVFAFREDDKRVGTVDPEYLRNSSMILDSKGNPLRTRPVQSWELLSDVNELLQEKSIDFVPDPIYVDRSSATKRMTRDERKMYSNDNTPIKYWVFNDLLTRFNFEGTGNDDVNGSIAVAFNSYGIQTAFGLNVRICQNMSILGGQVMNTYGRQRISYEEMIGNIGEWLNNLTEKVAAEMDIMDRLKNSVIWNSSAPTSKYSIAEERILGAIYKRAVFSNYFDTRVQAPLNQHNVSKFCQRIISEKDSFIEKGEFNAWDLYNLGTQILKPGNLDTKNIIDNNYLWLVMLNEMLGIQLRLENTEINE